jgi:putative ABC transport system permease protein
VAASNLLRSTNRRVGDTIVLAGHSGRREVRIVGEVLDLNNGGRELIMDEATLASITETAPPETWEVAVRPGTDPEAYINALSAKVTNKDVVFDLRAAQHDTLTFDILRGLIAILALLLSTVAALAVFSTVVLDTRERVHEIGILKAIGMTPRQVRVMFVASMATVGVVGGLIALPLGYLLHHAVLPVMADAAGTRLPQDMIAVFQPVEFVLLALAGVVITVLGALIPAGWTARAPAVSALRAE